MKVHQKQGFITCLKAVFSFQKQLIQHYQKTRCFKVLCSTPCVCTVCNESSKKCYFTVPQTPEYFRRSQTMHKFNLNHKVDKLQLPFFILLFLFFQGTFRIFNDPDSNQQSLSKLHLPSRKPVDCVVRVYVVRVSTKTCFWTNHTFLKLFK